MKQDLLEKTYRISPQCLSLATVAKENQSEFRIYTEGVKSETFIRIKVDDCFIIGHKMDRCDFAFHRCANEDFYFVELKGSDIGKAYQQIITTLSQHIPTPKEKRLGFIVTSRMPKSGPDVNKLKNEFRVKYGRQLFIKNIRLVFDPVLESIR